MTQNALFKVTEKLDQYEKQFKLNQEQLQQWSMAKKQKDDDHLMLEK